MKKSLALLCSLFLLFSLMLLPAGPVHADSGPVPGDLFVFGSFEQDAFSAGGKEPILWRVLDRDQASGLVLAVSEYGLYTMKYHRNNNRTAWGDTDVRNWLNTVFLSSFTEWERQEIVVTPVSDSLDTFFLLDSDQISRYLSSPYLCYATPYALISGDEGAYVNEDTGASSWLVRTDVAQKRIAWVGGGGLLYSPDGKKGVNYMTSGDNVVRPAMWIREEACGRDGEEYRFPLYARTLMRLSTRSGPSTGYNGLGDYFQGGGQPVRVLSRAHDGSIWWLEIEFEYNGSLVRCYTGLKRVNIDISRVPDDPSRSLGSARVLYDTQAWYGPGTAYKMLPANLTPSAGTEGEIVRSENGWICLEYRDKKQSVRVWLPQEAVGVE